MNPTPSATVLDEVTVRTGEKIAVLDLGSNSFHLVIARVIAGSVQILHKTKIKVHLADGLSTDNLLSEQAIQRGLNALQVIEKSLAGFAPESVRIVATYTFRKARNTWQFVEAARAVLPYPIEVISGNEEARLIFNGVAHTMQLAKPTLVVDIGGGSTEFIIGQGETPNLLRSLDMGCVSFSKAYFDRGLLKAKHFEKAITAAQQLLERIEDRYQKHGWQLAVGTSGTVESIIRCCGKDEPDYAVTLSDLEALQQQLVDASHIDNLKLDYVNDDRIPVLPAGLAILIAVFKSLHVSSMIFNSAALREGVIYEMQQTELTGDVRERSVQSLASRYDVDIEQAKLVHRCALDLFEQAKTDWHMSSKRLKPLLGFAALLHEIGLHINSKSVHRHSHYILQNTELPGFNVEQQEFVAWLCRLQRKRIDLTQIPRFSQFRQIEFVHCVILLRLSVLLNVKRQTELLPDVSLTVLGDKITLQFPAGWLTQHPIIYADLQAEQQKLRKIDFRLELKAQ